MKRLVWVLMLTAVVALFLSWQTYRYVRDWGLEQVHETGSQRLLDTISALRTTINQYRYLPFLLSQSRDVRELLLQPFPERIIRVSRYLEQTNLIAGSAALMVLDTSGKVMAYSDWQTPGGAQLSYHDAVFFQQALAGEQGRYFVTEAEGVGASYYLSAPIYDQQRLLGVSVVRLDVSKLREQLSLDHAYYVADVKSQLLFSSTQLNRMTADIWPLQGHREEQLLDLRTIRIWPAVDAPQMDIQVLLDDLRWRVGVLEPVAPAVRRAVFAAFTVAGGCLALVLLVLYVREYRLKRRSQAALLNAQRESEQRQRYIINTAQVGLISVASNGKIQFVNPMVMQQFGVSQQLIEQQPLKSLFADLDSFAPLQLWFRRFERGEFNPITGYEVVGRRSDGSAFPMLFSIRLMMALPQPTYLVTIIDITRRKRLEYALREANESLEQKVQARTQALRSTQAELVQAEKLAALGRMSTAIVHELNQPLTAMRNYLAICKQAQDHPELMQENIALLGGLVDRMALITGQLKSFAYKKPQQMGQADVAALLARALRHMAVRFQEQHISVEYQEPESTVWVAGDAIRVEQVINNLLSNACDALQDRATDRALWLSLKVSEHWVSFKVKDNGPGADEEQLNHMFEPFYTTKQMGEGLGLGLAIVASIVRDIGGRVEVAANDDAGLCFTVLFRCVESAD